MAADPISENVTNDLEQDQSGASVDRAVDHGMDDLAAAMTVVPRKPSPPEAPSLASEDGAGSEGDVDQVTGESPQPPVDPLTNPVPPPPKPRPIPPLNPPDPEAPTPDPPQTLRELAIAPDEAPETNPAPSATTDEESPEAKESETTPKGETETKELIEEEAPDQDQDKEEETPKLIAWFEPPLERSPGLVLAPVGDRVRMTLPADPSANQKGLTWTALWQKLMHQIHNETRFWTPDMEVELVCYGRGLEERQLGAIAEVLEEVQLQPVKLFCDLPETAQVAIAAGYGLSYTPMDEVEIKSEYEGEGGGEIDGLYLDRSVRSGVEINYPGSVVVRGDINPGGAVIAGGDIIVWGRLRGIAHAGANGNYQATIQALRLEATQIRIASRAARVPPADDAPPQPEVAHVDGNTIRISSAYDYDKKVIPKQPLPKLPKP